MTTASRIVPRLCRISRPFGLLLCLLLFLPAAAVCQKNATSPGPGVAATTLPRVLAILPPQVAGADENEAEAMAETTAAMLTTAAFNTDRFQLVERSLLKKVLDERLMGRNALSLGGDTAEQIQSLTGADAVLTGILSRMGQSLRLDARIVDVRSGALLAAARQFATWNIQDLSTACDALMAALMQGQPDGSVPDHEERPEPSGTGKLFVHIAPPDMENLRVRVLSVRPRFQQGMELPAGRHVVEVTAPGRQGVERAVLIQGGRDNHVNVELEPTATSDRAFAFAVMARPGGIGMPVSVMHGGAMDSGDHYKVRFTPQRGGYAYIYQVDSAGQIFQLFPMQRFGGVELDNLNPLRAGESRVLPAPDKSFVLDRTTGTERIYCFTSDTPQIHAEALYADLERARAGGDVAGVARLQTMLLELLEGRTARTEGFAASSVPMPWGETHDVFAATAQTIPELEGERVHVFTFEHR